MSVTFDTEMNEVIEYAVSCYCKHVDSAVLKDYSEAISYLKWAQENRISPAGQHTEACKNYGYELKLDIITDSSDSPFANFSNYNARRILNCLNIESNELCGSIDSEELLGLVLLAEALGFDEVKTKKDIHIDDSFTEEYYLNSLKSIKEVCEYARNMGRKVTWG